MLLSLGENTDNDAVRKIVESFQKDDDVFSNDFLTDTVMIQRTVGKPSTSKLSHVLWDTLNLNTSDGPWKPARVITVDAKHELPPGPYFLASGNTLAQAWRLFPDTQDAFTTTFVPASNNSLK